MTSKIKQGMHLRQPENSSDGAWIFQTLAAMLACAALMFALAALAGFRTGNLLPILLAAGGYVCIAYGVTIRFQRQQWFFLAALAALLLLVLICRQQVLEGYRLFWNQMRNTYTAAAVPFSLSTVSAVKSAVPPILLNFTASLISAAVRQQCVGRKVSAGSSEFSTASKSGFSLSFPLPTCIMTYPFLPLSMLLTRTSVPRRANSRHVTFEPRWSDMAIFTPIISPISAIWKTRSGRSSA